MDFERLDFGGLREGNRAKAAGIMRDAEAMAKAKQARDRGLEKGIGTIIGFMFGGSAGAAAGNSIAGMLGGEKGISSGITLPESNKARSGSIPFAGGDTPTWLNDPKTGGQINDPMQVASANNSIEEENPGLWAKLKNVWNNGIF